MNTHRMRPPLARIKIAACLAVTFAGVNSADAEVVIKPRISSERGKWSSKRIQRPEPVIVDVSAAIG
jgi:hypothetical protein